MSDKGSSYSGLSYYFDNTFNLYYITCWNYLGGSILVIYYENI